MSNIETSYFDVAYRYNPRFANKCLCIIRYSNSVRRVTAFKNLLFKMMGNIVRKNISNYCNLARNVWDGEMETRDEILSDCYMMFDKCCYKFLICKQYNFYFYFNKGLSRMLFKKYTQYYTHSTTKNNIERVSLTLKNVVSTNGNESWELDLLYEKIGLNELEIMIVKSRISGKRISQFLKENPEITTSQYSKILKKVKKILIDIKL